ncbi:MAG: acyl-CoA synthetase [Myxococcota bacterium]|nr:acyl-CoA synthetase [Myxococcota bacterium]
MEFNLAQVHEAIATAIPERDCLIFGDRRLTWSQLTDRTRRLANFLLEQDLGIRRERSQLSNWESGQDHVALLLHNGNEYLEAMLGAFKARLVPLNLNYRFVERELLEILRDAGARALVFHSCFAPQVEKIAAELPELRVLLQVEDDSGAATLADALDYETALASSKPERPALDWSPDDLYATYTGGTTGLPKGVLWRQADIFVANMNGRREDGTLFDDLDAIVERARATEFRVLPQAPFMHVAGHSTALGMWNAGGTVVIPDKADAFDPASILECLEREQVNMTVLVGDSMARPLVAALRANGRDLNPLQMIISGGAGLSRRTKEELLELLPHVTIIEGVGSSETGGQASNVSSAAGGVSSGGFALGHGTTLLNEDKTECLAPSDTRVGWLARSGSIPLGYLGDAEKTAETFPTIAGTRYVVPGDRARWKNEGELEFLGRDSTKINSGGEKIFAEEVEVALKQHPAVLDAAVAGRPSDRWGEEVVAIVQLQPDQEVTPAALRESCEGSLASFKLPKAIYFRNTIQRGPAGKIDLTWLRQQVAEEASQ